MIQKVLLASVLLLGIASFAQSYAATEIDVVTNCNGTQIVRTGVARFEVRSVEKNMIGCTNGSKAIASTTTLSSVVTTSSGMSSSSGMLDSTSRTDVGISTTVTNCNGTQIMRMSDGSFVLRHVSENLPSCVQSLSISGSIDTPHIDLSHGPLFDIRSTEMMAYRVEQLIQKRILFVNAIRSLKMRRQASMNSVVNSYLMKNDSVVVDGKESGWTHVQGATLNVSDDKENIIQADTAKRAKGFVARKYLRNPNTTDLVRIGQADHAYWSDIAHVKVSHLVNLRANPWYGAKILMTLTNETRLFVIATVDNWSEVRNDEGTIRGYVRSDYIVIDKAQRVDNWIGIK